jgi:diguanylate cyclase (GGDEF)-like protein
MDGFRQLRRDPTLRALVALSAVAVPVYGLAPGVNQTFSIVTWALVTITQAMQTRMCLSVVRRPGAAPAQRRFFGLFAAGSACFVTSSLAQNWLAITQPDNPDVVRGGAVSGVAVAVGAAFLIAALLTSPLGLTSRRERLRFWLDTGTVMIAATLVVWQVTSLSSEDGAEFTAVEFVFRHAGPAAFLVMIFGLIKILLGGAAPFTPLAASIGGVAAAIEGGLAAAAGPLLAADRDAWLLGMALLANTAFAAAVRVHLLQVIRPAGPTDRQRRRGYTPLPYLTMLMSYALLVWVLLTDGLTGGAWVVLSGVTLSGILVVFRQLAAFADNSELVERLHEALAERDELARQLTHQAFHDSLTGLANRARFLQRLDEALAGEDAVAVAIIDLDNFKPVNDRLGHAAGDALLREVSARLARSVGGDGLVARLGGDEFAVLLERPDRDPAELPALIAHAVRAPVLLHGQTLRVHASVGLAVTDGRHRDAGALLHEADLAMYAHKHRAKAA